MMKERKNFIVRVEPKTTNIKGQQTKRKVTGQTLDHHLKPLLAPPSDPDLINLVQATEKKNGHPKIRIIHDLLKFLDTKA